MGDRSGTAPSRPLPISGWTIRIGRAAADRVALEVYEGDRLADVCVATPVSVSVLRGARRGPRRPVGWALAWGQLPAGASTATAEFTGPGRAVARVPAVIVGGAYWVAEASGDFTGVTIRSGTTLVSGRLRRSRRR